MKERVVSLFSGGVESTALLYYFLRRDYLVYPIYIRSGHPWERAELLVAKKVWRRVRTEHNNLMPLRVLRSAGPFIQVSKEWDAFIPLRNLTLITSAVNYALSKNITKVAIGSLGIYPFPDNNSAYLSSLEKLVSLGTKREIKILAPFLGLHKESVIKLLKAPYLITISCIMPRILGGRVIPCGRCVKCKERQEANI